MRWAALSDPVVWAVVALALVGGLLVGWLLGRPRLRPSRTVAPRAGLDPEVVQVLDALASTVIVLDAANRVVHSTHRAADRGFVRDGVVPHPEVREMVEEARSTGEVQDGDVEVARSVLVGGRIRLGCRTFALSDRWVVVMLEDRSRAHRVEAVRRDFVANVSHELKTPVGGISLLAEAVQDAHDDPEAVQRFAGRMVLEAERLSRLVQEIVEFSRLQAGEAIEDPQPVNVLDVVTSAIDHVQVQADDRGIAVRQAGVAHGFPHRVYGDADLLTTAVRNLLVNAINYSDPGTKVVVTLSADLPSQSVRIAVTDQGIGIPAADLERIFERFYRVDAARSRHTGGTGLGLAIVKHAVAQNGGTVSVWSHPGTGSTFTLELPIMEGAGEQAPTPDVASLT